MAIVLMEEILVGLDEVKGSLDQAVTTLEDIIEDMSPDLGENLQEMLEVSFLDPLQSRRNALDCLPPHSPCRRALPQSRPGVGESSCTEACTASIVVTSTRVAPS